MNADGTMYSGSFCCRKLRSSLTDGALRQEQRRHKPPAACLHGLLLASTTRLFNGGVVSEHGFDLTQFDAIAADLDLSYRCDPDTRCPRRRDNVAQDPRT